MAATVKTKCFAFRNEKTGRFKFIYGADVDVKTIDKGNYKFVGKFDNLDAARKELRNRYLNEEIKEQEYDDLDDPRLQKTIGVI